MTVAPFDNGPAAGSDRVHHRRGKIVELICRRSRRPLPERIAHRYVHGAAQTARRRVGEDLRVRVVLAAVDRRRGHAEKDIGKRPTQTCAVDSHYVAAAQRAGGGADAVTFGVALSVTGVWPVPV